MNAIEKHYDESAAQYDDVRQSLVFKIYDALTWKYLEPLVPTNQNSLVLDAGGGTGIWAIQMAKKGCRVVLLDISTNMLGVARKKIVEEGLQDYIDVKKADITKLDYPDETFDLILSEHTLFLFEQPDDVVAELVRVLKKNAPIVMSAQNRLVQTLAHLPENPGENPDILTTAIQVFHGQKHDMLSKERPIQIFSLTPEEFRNLLQKNGLEVERLFCKLATMPLRFSPKFFMNSDVPKGIESRILQLELAFSMQPHTEALGAHLQAIARKK